tara:strand:- start:905 stop:1276 length:372 start_codon:yes stop_codon:yes gene_type:complete
MITIKAVGKLDKDLKKISNEYSKRFKIQIEEVKELKLSKNYNIVCSEEGKQFTSEQFAKLIKEKENITFLIGDAFGIDEKIKKEANLILSLSKMTFPHKLFRIFLIEQIYRATTINKNLKYHK